MLEKANAVEREDNRARKDKREGETIGRTRKTRLEKVKLVFTCPSNSLSSRVVFWTAISVALAQQIRRPNQSATLLERS